MPVALELGTGWVLIERLRDLLCAYPTMQLHIIRRDAIGDAAKTQGFGEPLEQEAAVVLKNCSTHATAREVAVCTFDKMRVASNAADLGDQPHGPCKLDVTFHREA